LKASFDDYGYYDVYDEEGHFVFQLLQKRKVVVPVVCSLAAVLRGVVWWGGWGHAQRFVVWWGGGSQLFVSIVQGNDPC
jgi:hypothetical protein